MAAGPVVVSVIGDVRDLQKSLKQGSRSLDEFSRQGASRLERLSDTLKDTGRALTTRLTLPIVALGAVAVKSFSDAQRATAQTEAVLKSTGGAAGVTAKHVENLSNKLAKLSGVDDDVIRSSQSVLLTFTAIKKEGGIFDLASRSALDLSVALGTDLQGASIQVGKALQDPINGVTALRRVGVSFTDAQREQIKAMVEAGDVAGAQRLILKELQVEFGGSAKAAGQTLAGQLGILRTQFENVTGQLVANVLPTFIRLIEKILGAVTAFGSLGIGTQQTIVVVGLAVAALGPLLSTIGNVIVAVRLLRSALIALEAVTLVSAGAIGIGILALAALAAGLVVAWQRSETFRDIVKGAFSLVASGVQAAWSVIRPILTFWLDLMQRIIDIGGKVVGIAGKIPILGGRGIGGLLPFQGGGVVPGKLGQPVPILAHGGERIIPAGMTVASPGIVIENFVVNQADASASDIVGELSWFVRTAGV